MPVYEYKAITKMGKVIVDKMNVDGSEQVVKEKLIETGLKPISIKKRRLCGIIYEKKIISG